MRYNISHLIMLLSLGRRKILRLYKADAINKTVINQVETQNFASHKRVFRKPMRYNISHLIMLLFLGRRKILRLYKADAITIKGNMEPNDAP